MRDFRLYLDDILEAVKRIEKYTKGLTFDKFREDDLILDGVVRNLEVIGEAVKNIPQSIKEEYSEVEWRKISGMRDILAHEYFGIDVEVIWDIIDEKLPVLKKQVRLILKNNNTKF
ncbi:MAG: hypothetical protein A2Z81_03235 [Omnitrophica WOR_2 bacterium GWA2_45_18]|nr:MAG: hypothetical protein A2Z81_03235 [Omnitrophica WOR_2 bacterium GWA2_45_18]